ncbi:MAG: hypothetical protein LUF30_01335, partial [Lachnospiraceae bacterium]|nr:hypothetical protein [Lachnospiraceae bacterium]
MIENAYDTLADADRRIRNLMWTVSGDYTLDTKPDVESYEKSKYISLHDAVRQGAFARFFDKNAFGLYLVKKIYCGADEQPLTELAQLCVDAASFPLAVLERPGIAELRERAFSDLLDHSFHKMSASIAGRMKIAWMRHCLDGDAGGERQVRKSILMLQSLEHIHKETAQELCSQEKHTKSEQAHCQEDYVNETARIIRTVDDLYNTLIDRSFVRKHGDLAQVLSVTLEDLKEFDWSDFLNDNFPYFGTNFAAYCPAA